MLDGFLLAKVSLVAALSAAAVMWLAAVGAPRPWRQTACWSWAIGAAVVVASALFDQRPHWPPLEDRARFLTVLVPLVAVGETMVAIVGYARLVRWALAAVTAPIVLHHSVYLADLSGAGSAEWPAPLATVILGGLAVTLAIVWTLLDHLRTRTSTAAVHGILAVDALAAAATIMLSGYYRAGLLALALGSAITGATLAARALRSRDLSRGSLGMSVVGLFAVVLMGRFFGSLSTPLAACLVLAPLLAWAIEWPTPRMRSSRWRSAARLACVAVPLAAVVAVAAWRFNAATRPPAKNVRMSCRSTSDLSAAFRS